jgi:PAS domain S-box-containing protein
MATYINTTGEKKIIGIGREVVGQRKDGSTFPLDLAVTDSSIDGQRYFLGIIRDLSERQRSQDELAVLQSRLLGVFNSVIDGVIIIDAKGTIDAFNPAAEGIFGYSEEEVLGKNVKILMPDPYRSGHDGYLSNHLATGEKKIIGIGREVSGLCKDGTVFPMDLAVSPMQIRGNPMFVGLVRNITERKQHEEDIKLAKLSAESANRMKSEFLANMSHELRTPLNAIIGYSEMLREDAEDEGNTQAMDDLNKICTSGNHLLKLINDVLDLAKIEAGRVELILENFSVCALVNDISMVIQHQMNNNDNHFEIVCAEAIGEITGDEGRLRQILFNLLSNAAKFTNKGRVTLTVKREEQQGKKYIAFNVTDTGIGMTPDQVAKVFTPFVQADASTTRQFGGTGLGLAISKDICDIMGGMLYARSEVGIGSTFTVRIPADLSLRAQQSQVKEKPVDSTTPDIYISEGSDDDQDNYVLVIDDDHKARDMIIRILEKDGFRLAGASNGLQGIALAKKLKPLCIILDVMMPDMDGWEVMSNLKHYPETANIPVIINTIGDKQDNKEIKGIISYLSKPFNKSEVLDLLNSLVPQQENLDVLIVENEMHIMELLMRQIETKGLIGRGCNNGLEALQEIQQKMPDIILLDLMMPKMDGFEFLTELRRVPGGNNVPVIILTAKDLTEQEEILLNKSAKLVIHKGDMNNIDELLPMVRRFISKPKPLGEPS